MVGITRYGGMLNINTRGEQVLVFVPVCLALVFVFTFLQCPAV